MEEVKFRIEAATHVSIGLQKLYLHAATGLIELGNQQMLKACGISNGDVLFLHVSAEQWEDQANAELQEAELKATANLEPDAMTQWESKCNTLLAQLDEQAHKEELEHAFTQFKMSQKVYMEAYAQAKADLAKFQRVDRRLSAKYGNMWGPYGFNRK